VRLPEEGMAFALRGDHVLAFERGRTLIGVWRMRFEPEVASADVIAEIEAHAPGRFVLREQGGDVLLFAGEDRAALDEFVAAFALPEPGAAALARSSLPRARPPLWRACPVH
jgi:hypothetical protein